MECNRINDLDRGINVLSLFDGISCGMVALERAGIKVDRYVAYEIDENAIKVSQDNYPDIERKGSVVGADFSKYKGFDLVIGGSPCQDLSVAKTNREGLSGSRSNLFYEYLRALKEVNPRYFLFENNHRMPEEAKEEITKCLKVEPILINSNLVSAQNRQRLYWTNIGFETDLKDKGILIKDIIYDIQYKIFDPEVELIKTKNYMKWDKSGKGYYSQQDRGYYLEGKMCTMMKSQALSKLNIYLGNGLFKRCHPIEGERLQTLPDNYTSIIKSPNTRLGLCGDGWTVEIIKHIFKGLYRGDNK